MSKLLDVLNVSQEEISKVEVAEIREGKEILDSNIYKTSIEMFLFKTNEKTDVKMLKTKATIIIDGTEHVLENYTNIIKKDGKSNEYGLRDLVGYLAAVGVDANDIETTLVEEKCYGSKKECNQINLPKHEVTAFVRKVFEEGADYPDYNEIEGIFDADGKNSKGEDQKEVFMTKIEKMPVLKRKVKAKNSSSNDKQATKEPSKKAKAML